jgi:hypothetical protein
MAPNLIFDVTEPSEESVVQHSSTGESVDFLKASLSSLFEK